MKKFDYYQPQTLKKAFDLMEKWKGRARYIAGGTDIIVSIKQKAVQPHALISLRGIEALKHIDHNSGLSLGSMTPFREMERDSVIAREYPALAQAVRVLANPQIRNVATLGGNICNAAPSADCAPPLMVMEASLTLEGPGGRRDVPIDGFFKGPGENCMEAGEVLTQIEIPDKADHTGMAFLKMGRVAQDIAIVNAAALLVMDHEKCLKCRLAVGAVAPVPLRLENVEKIIEGEEIGPDLLGRVDQMVEKEISPITDVRSTEEYRRTMSGILVKKAIEQAIENAEAGVGEGKSAIVSVPTQVPESEGTSNSQKSKIQNPKSAMRKIINFTLNGHEVSAEVESYKMLLQVLRDTFQLTGTKEGCGEGECGACTVMGDGISVDSCLYPVFEIEGKSVTTIEGLVGEGNKLHPI